MTFVIVMGFHQIIVVMNEVKRHTYIHTYKEEGCSFPNQLISLHESKFG